MFLRSRWLGPLLILAVFVFGLAIYGWLPSSVPTHWGANGRADGTMPRSLAVMALPVAALLVWALLEGLPHIDPRSRNYAAFLPTYRLLENAVIAFLVAIQVVVLLHAAGAHVNPARIVPVAVGVLFAVIGNELGRIRPNWFAGIRTPWTLSDETVWRRTHRVGARAFVALGLTIVVLCALLPLVATVWVILAGTLGVSGFLTLYSYLLYSWLHSGHA